MPQSQECCDGFEENEIVEMKNSRDTLWYTGMVSKASGPLRIRFLNDSVDYATDWDNVRTKVRGACSYGNYRYGVHEAIVETIKPTGTYDWERDGIEASIKNPTAAGVYPTMKGEADFRVKMGGVYRICWSVNGQFDSTHV